MICARLLGFNVSACRQAMIFVGGGRFRLRDSQCKIVSSLVLQRNLYETVKKRALEARAKLKKNELAHSRPCPDTCNEQDELSKKSKNKSEQSNKNVKTLNVKDKETYPRTEPCVTKTTGGGDNLKWILGGLAAAFGLGFLALLLGKDDKKGPQDCKPPQVAAGGVPTPIPASSADLPKKVPYLLVGGGTASFSAFRAIKSNDPKAKVLVISNEYMKPYMRPPLSKELWYASEPGVIPKDYRFKQWTGAERSLFFEPPEFFVDPAKLLETENGGIAVAHGYTVKKVDPKRKIVTLSDGTEIEYEKCLLATGSTPKNLPVFANASKNIQEKVMFYRAPGDFERLKKLVDEKKSITVIGSGFLGSELSCSLATYSKGKTKVNQIYPESGNMSKVLPEYLSKWTTRKVEAQGVCVVPGVQVKEVNREGSSLKLVLSNGQIILTDMVVVCVGCEANTDIATISGLEIDGDLGGFVVNAELEARQNLFVAGDASCFYDPLLGRRRLEHHDHSVISGRLAGENMVAKDNIKKAYEHQSMFWSDLGPGIGYEGIGRTDASLPTVGVFALPSEIVRKSDNLDPTKEQSSESAAPIAAKASEESKKDIKTVETTSACDYEESDYGKGIIFYLKDDKIVGILLWNIFNRIGLARTIVHQNKSYKDLNEVAKLFEIHS